MGHKLTVLVFALLLSACGTTQFTHLASPTLVTFEARCLPLYADSPPVYTLDTIHLLLDRKCIQRFEFDVAKGVPHTEYLEHSSVAKKLSGLKIPYNLTGRILGPECLQDTLPDFYQRCGVIHRYYVIHYDPEGVINSVRLVGDTVKSRTKNLFSLCRPGDLIVGDFVF